MAMPALGTRHEAVPKPSIRPSAMDLAWIAGFLEGEGSFSRTRGKSSGFIQVSQKDRESLERLQRFLGGTIFQIKPATASAPLADGRVITNGPIWGWQRHGPWARGIGMTIYSFMSKRRQRQIRWMLNVPGEQPPRRGSVMEA